MFTKCSRHVQDIFMTCSQDVHNMLENMFTTSGVDTELITGGANFFSTPWSSPQGCL